MWPDAGFAALWTSEWWRWNRSEASQHVPEVCRVKKTRYENLATPFSRPDDTEITSFCSVDAAVCYLSVGFGKNRLHCKFPDLTLEVLADAEYFQPCIQFMFGIILLVFGRARRRWEDNIKMDLQEVGCEGMDWIGLAQDKDRWRALLNAVMNLLVA